MTTLPQTTPIRLPRVASGGSQLAVPNGSLPAGMAGPAVNQMSLNDVWRVIRSNLWLILLLVAASAVGGFFLNRHLTKYYARYTTSGLLRLRAIQSPDPLHGTPTLIGQEMMMAQLTQALLIRSDGLLDGVLMDGDNSLRQTDWWRKLCNGDPQVAHQKLNEQFSVEPEVGSELIRLSITGPYKADTATLIEAIGDKAIYNAKTDNRARISAQQRALLDAKTGNDTQFRTASRDVRELADELARDGGNTAQGSTGSKQIELSREIERNILLQNDKVTSENAYNAVQSQLSRGETPGRVQATVDADPEVRDYRLRLRDLDDRIGTVATGDNENNPTLQALRRSRELTQKSLDNTQAEKTGQFSRLIIDELAAQRQTTGQLLDQSNAQVALLKQSIADLANKYASYLGKKDEEAGFRDLDKQYRGQLANIENLMREADFGSLAWYVHPLEPAAPSYPKMATVMMGTTLSGLLLGLGIAFARELTDTTVRSDRDITRLGQLTLLGMVPHEADDPQSNGARLPLVIFEAPQSVMAERLRQVRTRLQHAASLDTTRSILVTSPGPGDGKSTIACNLAAGLALNGRRILLVDANFRRPELHRIFGVGNEVGFSDVLNDVNAFASAVRETTVPNLSVLPSGPRPGNSTELLESQLLLDVVERALEEYDHVIFDSGPMLFVSESVALAPRVDGVITVVRARSSSRGVLTRMRDGLRAVKAEHLGVVLNGVRSQAGGYYGRSIKMHYEYQNQD